MVQVLIADSDKFKSPLAEPWAKLVHLVQQRGSYSHIIAASNSFGKNIMPRAAALLDVSPITDVTGISDSHTFVRYIFLCSLFFLINMTLAVYCTILYWSPIKSIMIWCYC